VCGVSAFLDVLSLGELFVSNFIDAGAAGERAPLDLVLCSKERGGCGLVQLRHSVDVEALYRTYWYRSGTNTSMRGELSAIARSAEEIAAPERGDIVHGDLAPVAGVLGALFIANPDLAREIRESLFDAAFNAEGFWGEGTSYYDQNWTWLTFALFSGETRDEWGK